MVLTRSQSDRTEMEERRREQREAQAARLAPMGPPLVHTEAPQSPSDVFAVPSLPPLEVPAEEGEAPSTSAGPSRRVAFTTAGMAERRVSPPASRCSTSTALRMRQAERDAERRMLALKKKELEQKLIQQKMEMELEKNLVQIQLRDQLDQLEAEGSQRGSVVVEDRRRDVDQWLDRCVGESPATVPAHPTASRGELGTPAPPHHRNLDQWTKQCVGESPTTVPAHPTASRGELGPPAPPHHRNVNQWLEGCVGGSPRATVPTHPTTSWEQGAGTAPPTAPEPLRGRSPTPPRNQGCEDLARALQQMARPQARYAGELPAFSGAPGEWLIFKAAVRDSVSIYKMSEVENLQRLRSCLRGEARDAVSALLHTASNTELIMKTLEQSFGRPDTIIEKAMDDLRKLPRPGQSATDLNKFAVRLQNVVCVLQNLGRKGDLNNGKLMKEVLDRLNPVLQRGWVNYALSHQHDEEPAVLMLSRYLMTEADLALRYMYSSTTTERTRPLETRPEKPPAAPRARKPAPVYAVAEEERPADRLERCPACKRSHALPQCQTYRAMDLEARWDLVKKNLLCFRCISSKHRRLACKAKPCGHTGCGSYQHHTTLHNDAARTTPRPAAPAATPAAPPAPPANREDSATTEQTHTGAVLSVSARPTDQKTTLLKVCPVMVTGPLGEKEAYALLDEGATVTLIDEALANSVGAEGPENALRLWGVNMVQKAQRSKTVTVSLRGIAEDAPFELKARTVRNLRIHEQSVPRTLTDFDHLRGLPNLAYPQVRPTILVGSDHWELIVSRELRIGEPNQPAASLTQLGWVLHGTVPRSFLYQDERVLHTYVPDRRQASTEDHDRRLHDLVESHFKIDVLGVAPKPRVSDADSRAEKIVQETMRKITEGYEAGLTWKTDDVHLPRSYDAAKRRLQHMERKMDADPAFAAAYTAEIKNLITKGYAEPCDGTEEASAVSWVLPHFSVTNPNKPGKLRLVFDAAHRNYGVSLNDYLLEGPDLLQGLQGILFRFREGPVAVCADIQEMFLRVKIRKEDQPAQQFLWRGADRTGPPQRYKMTSMIFGAASSPFMAHSVRNHNARAHARTHPYALRAITESHYMDDLVDSYHDEEEARLTISEVQEVHAAAGFKLRGWSSNRPEVLLSVPEELKVNTPTPLGAGSPEPKILGLFWSCLTDELGFNTSLHRVPADVRSGRRAPTKREALSAVMSVYDPLGLLSHFTIRAKIILQQLWKIQVGWDEAIPDEDAVEFSEWLRQLDEVARLRLPRHYGCGQDTELHVLCDASEQAYAAAAYWRSTRPDGRITVTLVAAKAKVAPRRAQTIPRLELQAAVLGARLAATIREEHRLKPRRTVYWTDSTTVVHWIKNDARRYTPFVAHRLGELAEATHRDEWRWLPTDENVADDATRQSNADITSSDRWFRGPAFLHRPEEDWPKPTRAEEEQAAEVLHVGEEDTPRPAWLPNPANFSKYETLVRAAARVLAFVDICRRRETKTEVQHVERAEQALLRLAQEDSFPEETKKLQSARPLTKASRLYKLDPIVEDGLLRVRGRINAAAAPNDTKRPIILDGRHHITRLLIKKEHAAAGHANRERVTNDLRQRYWVLQLRPTVRAVEKNCSYCRVLRARPRPPATGDLPRARLDPFHRPFTNTGVDYFGPMMVKIGRRREKRWGALFTCLTTRAVHLEVVASLSTSSAIMALRRMAARRGWPSTIYSDNGTNFKGADAELRAAYAEWGPALHEEALLHRTRWVFIPPGSPNQGGAWERMVRSVKTALQTTLKEKAPSEEVLQTLLTEAEHSINARPLTHVSVDPRDPEALTPNHFLLGSSLGLPSTGPCEEADRRTWRASQALADQFWRRWVREYLPTLVARGEPMNERRNLHVGDIVVVADASLPRNVWPLGVVERVHPGPDGGVRVADVKTKSGVFRRPTSRLAVLIEEEGFASFAGGRLLRTASNTLPN